MRFLKTLFTLLFVVHIFTLSAQDEIKKQSKINSLKLYVNAFYSYSENDEYNGFYQNIDNYLFSQKKYGFGALSFALDIQGRNKLLHEIELMPIDLQITDESETLNIGDTLDHIMRGNRITSIESYVRYQLNYYFTKKGIAVPYIGLSTKIYYDYLRDSPKVSTYFMRTGQNVGLNFSIIPSVSFKLSENIALDLNMPISFLDMKLNMDNYENPALSVEDQKTNIYITELLPKKLNFRVGITYKI